MAFLLSIITVPVCQAWHTGTVWLHVSNKVLNKVFPAVITRISLKTDLSYCSFSNVVPLDCSSATNSSFTFTSFEPVLHDELSYSAQFAPHIASFLKFDNFTSMLLKHIEWLIVLITPYIITNRSIAGI